MVFLQMLNKLKVDDCKLTRVVLARRLDFPLQCCHFEADVSM
ncbi:hypothetical protein GA0061082_10822 [Snodgrassella sp. R-53583]|uniref:Uncharacterized protein n=1 Tax=Snodgrassella communis TaxID=2946699 RepID=A0A836Z5I5_9NEIS|nr:hypothetical protein SALWKB12_0146 [Snodgrassella communis]KDN15596.1 hypothetical protein SALWKB29_0015 [Snodgrassella communis]SCC07358.1 hypothetical protein GA0061082_10822 [Snodgrassella sp. R-53583]